MKKRVGSYKGKPIVELGGGGENILTKNELTTNSFGGSNKYKGEYYKVKKEYQKGFIKKFFRSHFDEGICSTESFYGTTILKGIDDTTGDSSYKIYYVKLYPFGYYNKLATTLKEKLIMTGSVSENEWDKTWNMFSTIIEPCTEEEYYSHFTGTINDII